MVSKVEIDLRSSDSSRLQHRCSFQRTVNNSYCISSGAGKSAFPLSGASYTEHKISFLVTLRHWLFLLIPQETPELVYSP